MVNLRLRPIPIWSKQQEFRQSKAWIRGFFAGRGAGKTKIGAIDILRRSRAGDPCMAISPDSNVIRDTTLPTFIETARATGQYVRDVVSPVPKVWFYCEDGGLADLIFKSAETPDKLRGPSKAYLWLDEATVMCREVFDLALPVLRHQGRMGPLVLTATPKGTRHWTFGLFYEEQDPLLVESRDPSSFIWIAGKPYLPKPNSHLVHASTRENPFLPAEFYSNIRSNYGQKLAEQELEGEFVELTGMMFRREWFQLVNSAPLDAMRVRYWDRAATPGSGCYTAGVLMARDRFGIFYVEHVIRGQWGPLERDRVIEQIAERDARLYRNEVLIYVEQEGGSGGKEVAGQMISNLSGFPVFRDVVSGTKFKTTGGEKLPGEAKIVRAMPLAAQVEAGNVRVVRGPWNNDYIEELCAFPQWAFADQVDASSGAFNKLAQSVMLDPGEFARLERAKRSQEFGALAALTQAKSARWENLPWALNSHNS
jgi:predicted phage terminase large subunit-like protein